MFGQYNILSEVYNESKMEIAAQMESQFNMAYMYGNIQLAYDTLGKLMEYGLINANDARLDPKGDFLKTVVKQGVASKEHRFNIDYRRGTTQLGKWLYGSLKRKMEVRLDATAYVKEVDNGDNKTQEIYGERTHTVDINLINSGRQAKTVVEDIGRLYKDRFKQDYVTQGDLALAEEGIIRIYNIEFTSHMVNYYKTLGFVVLAPVDTGIRGLIVIKTDALKKYHIDVQTAYNKILYSLQTVGELGKVQFMPWYDLSVHAKEQKEERRRQSMLINQLVTK